MWVLLFWCPAVFGRIKQESNQFPFQINFVNNNDNILFMVPHLVRAQSAYKDIRIHSFITHTHTHTHTHRRTRAHTRTHIHTHAHTHTRTTDTCITGDGLVKRQISMQRRRDGFSVLPLTYEEGRQFVNM